MTEQIQTPTKVFISYSWDSEDHKNKVLGLANTLRSELGINTEIDRYVRAEPPYTPAQGWDIWMSDRIEWAEFVLIIFTETYKRRFEGKEETGKGLGVSWEGTIIRNDLYNAQLRDTKFIPVVFSQSDLGYVPLVLNSRDKYILTDDKSFTELYYRLRKEPTIIKPEIKGVHLPLPSQPMLLSPQKPPVESSLEQTPESVSEKSLKSDELISETQPAFSRSLTDSRRQRLKQRQDTLQAEWQLRSNKLNKLRQDNAIEVGTAIKFQLQQQIQSEETQLSHLERDLEEIEQNLSLGAGFSTFQTSSEIEYRKKVEEYVNKLPLSEPYNEISNINKTNLAKIRQRIGIDTDKAKAIENAVLQSRCQLHEEYKQHLQQYQNILMENLEREGFFSDDILSDLKELQKNLQLSDKDAEELLLYAQLEYSLKKESWIEADEITKNLLLKVANVQQKYFSLTDFQKIPCQDIRKIDKLWTDYSKGNFGYSAQIDIWQQVKERPEVKDILYDFLVELDWGYKEDRLFVYTDQFKYNQPNPPKGHLPALVLWEGGTNETRQAYINRIQYCCKDIVR